MLFFLLALFLITTKANDCACDVCVGQSDFNKGTLRIKEPKSVCIIENIVFQPEQFNAVIENPQINKLDPRSIDGFPTDEAEYPGVTKMRKGVYALGYLAVIQIQSNDVTIDLQGHSIEMSKHFWLQQRWGSIIQVGLSPFQKEEGSQCTQGPTNFLQPEVQTPEFTNIIIKNGKLGRSCHHGILANSLKDITITDIEVENFEVAGIQVNGFDNLIMKNINVHDSVTDLPVTAEYNSARLMLQAFLRYGWDTNNTIIGAFPANDPKFALRPGFKKKYSSIYNDLKTVLDITYRYAIDQMTTQDRNNELWLANKDIFINEKQLPDGSSLAGIVLHSNHVAIKGFTKGDQHERSGVATLDNIIVDGLKSATIEIPVLDWNVCQREEFQGVVFKDFSLRGPFSDYLNVPRTYNETYRQKFADGEWSKIFQDSEAKYVGNVLSDAKIASAYMTNGKLVSPGGVMLFQGENGAWRDETLNPYLKWVYHHEKLPTCIEDWQCNRDVMGHWIKGIMGIRIQEIEQVNINNVKISNLHNYSPLSSRSCKSYNKFEDDSEGAMGGDVRGISVASATVNIASSESISTNTMSDFTSDYGDIAGIYVNGPNLEEPDKVNYPNPNHKFIVDSNTFKAGVALDQKTVSYLVDQNSIPYPYNFFSCYELFNNPMSQYNLASHKCINRLDDFKNTSNIQYPESIYPQIIDPNGEKPIVNDAQSERAAQQEQNQLDRDKLQAEREAARLNKAGARLLKEKLALNALASQVENEIKSIGN